MKKENLKKALLPIGLLIIGSSYFTKYFMEHPESVRDFLIGLGTALVLSSLYFRSRFRTAN